MTHDIRINEFPLSMDHIPIYMVGIKGQGMTALAEVLKARGADVSGSDTKERFYTDSILKKLGIPFFEDFSADHIRADFFCVVHSVAYDPEAHVELKVARGLGVPILTYPQALGKLSKQVDFSGISGIHGKTTTTALAGTLLKHLSLPVTVLVGSGVANFGDRSTLILGNRYLVAETDEYRRNFLHYHPDRIVITSIEPDHLDYYKDVEDIIDAFVEYGRSLTERGSLIYNTDDPFVRRAIDLIRQGRGDIELIPYGRGAIGNYRIERVRMNSGEVCFNLSGFDIEFRLRVPGEHSVYNTAAALALSAEIHRKELASEPDPVLLAHAVESFRGSRRRCEIVGSFNGTLIMDDYAHHPTAIRKTLKGLRRFYPEKRFVVDFMSHTYSRTQALLEDFARSFELADVVILHKIYASAREVNRGGISGKDLYREVSRHHPRVEYFEEPEGALDLLRTILGQGDLFLTMGAGNNWQLGRSLLEGLSEGAKGVSQ